MKYASEKLGRENESFSRRRERRRRGGGWGGEHGVWFCSMREKLASYQRAAETVKRELELKPTHL